MGYLCLVLLSTMTEASVVSLPVPAVVGTAIRRGIFLRTLSIPSIFESGFLGYAILAPTAFAASMDEPPPKPMMASQSSFIYKALASSTLSVVGLATVLSYTATLIPQDARFSSSGFVIPSPLIEGSVTRRTDFMFFFAKSDGSSLIDERISGFL